MSDIPYLRDAPGPDHNAPALSVSELSAQLKRKVEDSFAYVRVRGEVSQPSSGSGHCYLRLKDEDAALDAIIWRGTLSRLSIRPEEGMEVIATGKLTTYPGRSSYQIIIESLELAGQGALLKLLEDRRKKTRRRRPVRRGAQEAAALPAYGHRRRDVADGRRYPRHSAPDQRALRLPRDHLAGAGTGRGAADEITAAINGFNALPEYGDIPRPDVIIVARGGGSLEDLWSFNEENVVRAAAASRIPLISAVGHETDTTLIDYASGPPRPDAHRRRRNGGSGAPRIARQRTAASWAPGAGHHASADRVPHPSRRSRPRAFPGLMRLSNKRPRISTCWPAGLSRGRRVCSGPKARTSAVISAKLNLDRFSREILRHGVDVENLVQRLARAGLRSVEDCKTKLEVLAARLASNSPARVLADCEARLESYAARLEIDLAPACA